MNTFGRLFRVSICGESHGPTVGVLLDGVPAGLPLAEVDFEADLARRRSGAKGTTARQEEDRLAFQSGVCNGHTTGAPLLILVENKDVDSRSYEECLHVPRPGHADWVALKKYGGHSDLRGSGHFSGRITVGLVAAGVIAKKILPGIEIVARLMEVNGMEDFDRAIAEALALGDSVGGVVECRVRGLPPGLGEPFFDSVESLLSHGAFSIPAVKAIEFGDGLSASRMMGSEFNDAFEDAEGRTRTNHAGGINGGITNGNELVFRVWVKPASSIRATQRTVDLRTGQQTTLSVVGRHDACIALRVPVVLEAVTAMVLADLMMLEGRIRRVI